MEELTSADAVRLPTCSSAAAEERWLPEGWAGSPRRCLLCPRTRSSRLLPAPGSLRNGPGTGWGRDYHQGCLAGGEERRCHRL